MWNISNDTAYSAERAFVRDKTGAELWIVAVKATFDISPIGELQLAAKQEPIRSTPIYLDADELGTDRLSADGQSSLLYESDLVLGKNTTDILLHGSAYAPGGKPTESCLVTLKVGTIEKSVLVVGDRRWERGWKGLQPSPAQPFVRMPLRYERAFGGCAAPQHDGEVDEHNPIGVGFGRCKEHLFDTPLPNLENPAQRITNWEARPGPCGFGPIARHWLPRRVRAGTYDQSWRERRAPLLPQDFELRFFQCAPDDQQPEQFLRGGELVELCNLTEGGLLRFVLPQIRLGFATEMNGATVSHASRLHTLILEPERARLIIVWQTALPCHNALYALRKTWVWEKRRLPRATTP